VEARADYDGASREPRYSAYVTDRLRSASDRRDAMQLLQGELLSPALDKLASAAPVERQVIMPTDERLRATNLVSALASFTNELAVANQALGTNLAQALKRGTEAGAMARTRLPDQLMALTDKLGVAFATNGFTAAKTSKDLKNATNFLNLAEGYGLTKPERAKLEAVLTVTPVLPSLPEVAFRGLTFVLVTNWPPNGGYAYVSQCEVTRKQYKELTGQSLPNPPTSLRNPDDTPADVPTWQAAQEFCLALNKQAAAGSSPFPGAGRIRLPTAQEYVRISGLSANDFEPGTTSISRAAFQQLISTQTYAPEPSGWVQTVRNGKANALGLFHVLDNSFQWSEEKTLLGLGQQATAQNIGRAKVKALVKSPADPEWSQAWYVKGLRPVWVPAAGPQGPVAADTRSAAR